MSLFTFDTYKKFLIEIGLKEQEPPSLEIPIPSTDFRFPSFGFEFNVINRHMEIWDLDHNSTTIFRECIVNDNIEEAKTLVNYVSQEELLITLALVIAFNKTDNVHLMKFLIYNIRVYPDRFLWVLENIDQRSIEYYYMLLCHVSEPYTNIFSFMYYDILKRNPSHISIIPEEKVLVYSTELYNAYIVNTNLYNEISGVQEEINFTKLLVLTNRDEFYRFLTYLHNSEEALNLIFRNFVQINSSDDIRKLRSVFQGDEFIQQLIDKKM